MNLTHSLHKVHALENLHIEVGSRIMMCFYVDIYLWCKYQGKKYTLFGMNIHILLSYKSTWLVNSSNLLYFNPTHDSKLI